MPLIYINRFLVERKRTEGKYIKQKTAKDAENCDIE